MSIVAPDSDTGSGSAPACDIVTLADYRHITGDADGTTGTVEQALAEALTITEGRLGRRLCQTVYTESLRPDSRGRLWPTAVPLVSVSIPTGATVRGNSIIGVGGWWGPDYTIAGGPGEPPYETSVTYTGGFTRATMPERLRRAVCLLAWLGLHPMTDPSTFTETTVSNLIANASSLRVGDVAVSGSSSSGGESGSSTSSGGVSSAPSLERQVNDYLAPFRRRHLVP